MKTGGRVILIAMILAVLAMVAVPLLFALPDNALIWIEIQNTGHTPLFGLIALLLLGISTRLLGDIVPKRQSHYTIALVGACLLGAMTEYAQIDGPRDADLADFLRDMAGAFAFLGLYMYFDVGLSQSSGRMSAGFRKTVLLSAVLILVASAVPLALTSAAYLHRKNVFPVICDFDSYWERRYLTSQSAYLKIVPAPSAMSSGIGSVGQLNLRVGEYPGFGIREPYPDWTHFSTLNFDIYSPLDTAVYIHLRVEDSHHSGDFADRFNRTLTIMPGENHIAVSLTEIRSAPHGRKMDMSAVAAMHFFMVDITERLTLYFDNLRLK